MPPRSCSNACVKSLSPGNLFSGVLELKDLLQRLPSRVNRFLDALANNELKISVDAIDEQKLMVGFQKVANRITVGSDCGRAHYRSGYY